MKFSRLLAYGCSHTAGAETQDEDYVPNADSIKKSIGLFNFMLKYNNVFQASYEGYIDAGKRKSYVRHLADKLNLPYENRAISGSGLAQHIYNIEKDLANNKIINSDLIIIGITSKDRVLWFQENESATILLSHSNTYPECLISHESAFLSYFNDRIVTFQNLMMFQHLLNLANTRLKNQLYFVFCDSWVMDLNYRWDGMQELPDDFKINMARLQDSFVNSEFVLLKTNLYHNTTNDELHTGNHVKELVHKRFAESLYPVVKKLL